jgi:deoxycytidylate deaminase
MEETDSRAAADDDRSSSTDDDGTEEGEGEIVIGFVAPTGTDSKKVHRVVTHVLGAYGYTHRDYRLSHMFSDARVEARIGVRADVSSEYTRIKSAMDGGDAIRSLAQQAEAVALYACTLIAKCREDASDGASDHASLPPPMPRTAHVVHSLKRPEEVVCLRRIYGSRFLLISIYTPREQRKLNLQERGLSEIQAVELISRDETGEPRSRAIAPKFTQATAKTFHMADLFVDGTRGDDEMHLALYRFFDLVFGCPLVTPTWEEHSMFLAYAASLRSGDLSRQVGAVITTRDGDVVAEGANDAPRAFGGQYWPGEDDQRDLARGFDSNDRVREQMITALSRELGKRFETTAIGSESARPDELLREALKESGFLGLTEFGRAVHAEMAALMSCVRRGVHARGCVLFCTTFPCHNCAKHIVAAGITKVYFIEPYPKSRAIELHSDSLTLVNEQGKVVFSPFVGIGPKRYVELFMLWDAFGNAMPRKSDTGELVEWQRAGRSPSLPDRLIPYIEQERRAVARLETALVSRAPDL